MKNKIEKVFQKDNCKTILEVKKKMKVLNDNDLGEILNEVVTEDASVLKGLSSDNPEDILEK